MEQKKIELKYPIKIKDVETNIVHMRRLKTKDLKLIPNKFLKMIGGAGKNTQRSLEKITLEILPDLIPLMASMLGITENECGEIDIQDLMQIAQGWGEILKN